MPRDSIVEEIREIRDAYAKQFNYDLDAIYRDFKEQEGRSGQEFVSFPPKRTERAEQEDPERQEGTGLTNPTT